MYDDTVKNIAVLRGDRFISQAEVVFKAREGRLESLRLSAGVGVEKEGLAVCLATCRTFAQFAGYIPYRVARVFASGLAHTACPAV
jgi:hypothetical protein